ncbi:PREDICTED: RPM1-interacting protein 4-like isoform X2 [Ipomoea nil]|uniref:RPM1-interacting protein 4-like isoform X2 n=1 Tax=Ipomoea nil TaxID=35883 RepID=UPI000900C95E|nr:PREDICTED: RPM1-interacting protein 4-like isoform X2 [Ipomoea nil]
MAQQHSPIPAFGNWESEGDVPYTVYFENTRKTKKGSKMNPKNLQEDSEAEPKGHKRVDARSTGSPHHQHGVKLQNEKLESEQKGQEALQPRHARQLNQDEGYLRNTDSSLRNANAARKTPFESPQHLYGGLSAGETTKKASRQSMGSDHSNEHSPLHPHFHVRTGVKGGGVSSPSWERKGSSEGGHGVPPFTPGRSRLRSITKDDDTPDHGPAVPKFGDWDETDPASAEEYTQVFEKVREEKQSGAEKVPSMPTEPSYSNSEKRYGNGNSKVCCTSGFLCICLAFYLKPHKVGFMAYKQYEY